MLPNKGYSNTAARYYGTARKVSPYGAAPGNKNFANTPRLDTLQTSGLNDNELALAMQGLRVDQQNSANGGYPQAPSPGGRVQGYPGYYPNSVNGKYSICMLHIPPS